MTFPARQKISVIVSVPQTDVFTWIESKFISIYRKKQTEKLETYTNLK